MNELAEAFNKKLPSAAVLKEYYSVMMTVPEEKASSFFRGILREFTFFPKISEIDGFVKSHFPVKIEHNYDEPDIDCPYCLNVGLIRGAWKGTYPRRDVVYEADLPCPKCERGKRFVSSATPYFDKYFGSEYLEERRLQNEPRYKQLLSWRKDKAKRNRDINETKARVALILKKWNIAIPQ